MAETFSSASGVNIAIIMLDIKKQDELGNVLVIEAELAKMRQILGAKQAANSRSTSKNTKILGVSKDAVGDISDQLQFAKIYEL